MAVDSGGVKKGTDEAARHLGGFESVVKRVGGVLAAAFTARAVVQFGKESVKAFSEAEVIWNRLGGTLAATGVQFSRVRGQIEGAARAMQDVTTVGDEDFAATLQTLVRITGDYQSSLKEVQTVANLAAGAQISLTTAATLVGKVMVGETGTLKRYGIVVKDGADAMQALRDRFKGLAENEALTLEGQMKRLNNEWGDFKEAIGKAVVGGADGVDVLKALSDKVKDLALAIDRHAPAIQSFMTDMKEIVAIAKVPIVITIKVVSGALAVVAAAIRSVRELFDKESLRASMDAQVAAEIGRPGRSLGMGEVRRQDSTFTPTLPPDLEAAAVAAEAAAAVAAEAAADALTKARDAADDLRQVIADKLVKTLRIFDLDLATASTSLARLGSPMGAAAFDKQARDRAASQGPLNLNRITDLRSISTPITANAPDAAGFLGTAFGALKTQVTGLATAFGPAAVAALALKPVFDGFREQIGPSLAKLTEPLNEIGRIIGTAVTPILEAFAEPLRLVAELFRTLMEPIRLIVKIMVSLFAPSLRVIGEILKVLTIAFSYVHQAIGTVIKALGDFVDKLVPDKISKVGKGLADMGQSMIDAAKAARNHTDTTLEATEALVSMTSSMSNVPSVFANALRRFQASTTGLGTTTTAAPWSPPIGTTGPSRHNGGLQPLVVNGDVTVVANNPEEFARQMEDYGARVEWRNGYSRFGTAVA